MLHRAADEGGLYAASLQRRAKIGRGVSVALLSAWRDGAGGRKDGGRGGSRSATLGGQMGMRRMANQGWIGAATTLILLLLRAYEAGGTPGVVGQRFIFSDGRCGCRCAGV